MNSSKIFISLSKESPGSENEDKKEDIECQGNGDKQHGMEKHLKVGHIFKRREVTTDTQGGFLMSLKLEEEAPITTQLS